MTLVISFQNYNDDNNNGDSNPSRSTLALSIQKKERHCFICFFFNHRIHVEAAHVRKILLVKLGLLQKDTVVSVNKDSGERIVSKVFCSLFIK